MKIRNFSFWLRFLLAVANQYFLLYLSSFLVPLQQCCGFRTDAKIVIKFQLHVKLHSQASWTRTLLQLQQLELWYHNLFQFHLWMVQCWQLKLSLRLQRRGHKRLQLHWCRGLFRIQQHFSLMNSSYLHICKRHVMLLHWLQRWQRAVLFHIFWHHKSKTIRI